MLSGIVRIAGRRTGILSLASGNHGILVVRFECFGSSQHEVPLSLQIVDERADAEKRDIAAQLIQVLRTGIGDRGRREIPDRLDFAVVARFSIRADELGTRNLNAVDEQAEELIDPPTLLIESVESLRGDRLKKQSRIRIVIHRNELEGGVVFPGHAGDAAAGWDLNSATSGGQLPVTGNGALHPVAARDLTQLEEISGIVVLEARQVQQQFLVGG